MMAVAQLRVLGGAMARCRRARRRSRTGTEVHGHRRELVERKEDLPDHEPWVLEVADLLRGETRPRT